MRVPAMAVAATIVLAATIGCHPAPGPPAASPAAAAADLPVTAPGGLAPLTPREAELRTELEAIVQHLAGEIGERNPSCRWELADTADYLAGELETAGYAVERQGHPVDDEVVAQNLVVQVNGGRRGNEVVVVGAHYDSASGSPGASDATGIAALLALARSLRDFDSLRTIRFAAFGVSHSPHALTPTMGSMVYAQKVAADGDQVVAMVGLESLGYFSELPGSQQPPSGLEGAYPNTGDFISFVGDMRADELADGMLRAFATHASIAARVDLLVEPTDGLGVSDSWAFSQLGFPAMSVTDTGGLRNPGLGTGSDTSERLDFERAARVVAGLEMALRKLAGSDQPLPHPNDLREPPRPPDAPDL